MLGYDVSWAAFNIIEVMSSPKFMHKVWFITQGMIHSSWHQILFASNI